MRKTLPFLALLGLVVPLALAAQEPDAAPAHTSEGLQLLPGDRGFTQVWLRPGTDLADYRRVYLAEPAVAFRKNWLKDQNRGHPSMRVKPSDMEVIARDLKTLLVTMLSDELLTAGYTFSEVRDHDVLIIKPAIVDLDINAPDVQVPNTTDILTSSAGSMTLYLEIYDSVSEELLMKAVDTATDRDTGHVHWQRKVANTAAFKRMIKPWAEALGRSFGTLEEPPPP